MSDPATNPRGKDVLAPFCWQEKAILRRIRDGCEGITYLDQVLAVYLAATELASNEGADSFTATKRRLSECSGVSPRRTEQCLDRLRALNVLIWSQNRIENSKELGPNTYTLLAAECPAQGAPGYAKPENRNLRSNRIKREENQKKGKKVPSQLLEAF